jgi:hypothetical protein
MQERVDESNNTDQTEYLQSSDYFPVSAAMNGCQIWQKCDFSRFSK